MSRGDYVPWYVEREITEPVDLCDGRGRLNPDAVGWSRFPIVRANLSGHPLRKKRWNFWNFICPGYVLTITLADIDYAGFCSVAFTDFETGESASTTSFARPRSFSMPEHVERTVRFESRTVRYANVNEGGRLEVGFRARTKEGEEIAGEFVVRRPEGHESLNIVVPWTPSRFQLNSKHNTLPCEGELTVRGRRYRMDPESCHAVQDFGRGVWPYRSFWNWAAGTGVQNGDLVGVNMGAKWTTGTGSNENGICLNGRLHKVMEDLAWSYDPGDWMKPWHVRAERSGVIDLTLEPLVVKRSNLQLGVIGTGGACAFGRWRGTVRVEDRSIRIDDLIGWAEEFAHRW